MRLTPPEEPMDAIAQIAQIVSTVPHAILPAVLVFPAMGIVMMMWLSIVSR
jgi:hypothetical protein